MRIQSNPAYALVYPNDEQIFEAAWVPPAAGWAGITNNGDIASDSSLFVVDPATEVTGTGVHRLKTGIGIAEWTIDNFFLPTSSGQFRFSGHVFDVNGLEYKYNVTISAAAVVVTDEASNVLLNQVYSTIAGDIYRMEMSGAGFRLLRGGAEQNARLNLPTQITYPFFYDCRLLKPVAGGATARMLPPRLIGDWRLHSVVDWTAPSHGSISTVGPSIKTRYFGGTTPGVYTLIGAIEASNDVLGIQKATAIIEIPALLILGNITDLTLQPGQKIRPKTNYDEAKNDKLVAWSVVVGGGSFTQDEFTAPTTPGLTIIRATASVNSQIADVAISIPAVITNVNNYTAAKPSEVVDYDVNIPTLPSFFAAGAVAEGTGAISAPLPLGLVKDDIMLLFVETANEAVSTPSGWAIVTDSPQGTGTAAGATSTRLSVFWKRVGDVPANEVAAAIADPGDHAVAQILAFRNCIATGNPWDVTSGDTGASSTSVSIPGDTTTVVNCLVVLAVANQTDSATPQTSGYTNADLANLTERTDVNSTQGNGGGFAVITGEKAAAGAYGATAATLANASVQGRMSIALKPAVTVWSASIGSINSSSGSFTAPSLPGQTARIKATNGSLSVTQEVDILEAFPRTNFKLPWPIDLAKRVLVSEAEDGSRTSRIKGRARRSFPVELLVDAIEDLNGAGLNTIQSFWDRHHPGVRFILEDPEESIRLVVYSDSDLRWEHTGAGINIAFRVKEAEN